jgi:hypothetical protein
MSGIQDFLIDQVKNAVLNHTNQQGTGFDPSGLLQQIEGAASQGNLNAGTITGMIQNHADNQAHTGFDPGPLINQVQGMLGQHQQPQQNNEAQYGNVKSSDEDPYGDPADEQGNVGNVKSSDEDPYGDPADEEQNARR